ncbi:MAG: insulinase family protein [Hyphomicrobiales bacterium]|nr:insulinase family protein [Hyphomicrobiales bacterium]
MMVRKRGFSFLLAFMMALSFNYSSSYADTSSKITETTLENGLRIVVIPDHRAPVVSHVIWYKVGAADEAPGKSGIAHFLEHLMFKGTKTVGPGEFSKIIARNGGQDNAFTSQDITAYFQRVATDRLPLVMEMEADRMANLTLDEDHVRTERDVVLEERRSRVDNDPSSILSEQMTAALYVAHPYRIPIIGWEHEIKKLNQEDAIAFYKRYYAPNNAILVVVGDVTADDVIELAKKTYGKVEPVDNIARSDRIEEPDHAAPRRVILADERVSQENLSRHYLGPSYTNADEREAEALTLLSSVMGANATGRLYRKLVVEEKIASSAGAWFSADAIDYGRFGVYAIPQGEATLADVEASIDQAIEEIKQNGVTEAELERARKEMIAQLVYSEDSQFNLARTYGWALAIGRTVEDLQKRAERLKAVSLDDIKAAAKKHLVLERSVTGELRQVLDETVSRDVAASKPKPNIQ